MLWVLWRMRFVIARQPLSLLSQYAFYALLGMSPYLYMPLTQFLHYPAITWGDNTTLEGFLIHFLRAEYGTFQLSDTPASTDAGMIENLTSGLSNYIMYFYRETYGIGPAILVIAVIAFVYRLWRYSDQVDPATGSIVDPVLSRYAISVFLILAVLMSHSVSANTH